MHVLNSTVGDAYNMSPHNAIQMALSPLIGIDDTRRAIDCIGDAEIALDRLG